MVAFKKVTSIFVKSIGVVAIDPPEPKVVLVDAGKLLYHVVWPCASGWHKT